MQHIQVKQCRSIRSSVRLLLIYNQYTGICDEGQQQIVFYIQKKLTLTIMSAFLYVFFKYFQNDNASFKKNDPNIDFYIFKHERMTCKREINFVYKSKSSNPIDEIITSSIF